MKQMETELQAARDRAAWLEEKQRGTGEEIWLAKERVANQDRELGELHQQCSWLRDENAKLQKQLEEERSRYTESDGVDWSKLEELNEQKKKIEDKLRDEKSKVEWRLGEVTQYWNDAKWRCV
ncbi:unnamed protein product [Gongylonema pulchrum]|uniref:Myosin_tail_1 domain-containing protein n=1 Tax=Gongylonema pulchrum TaxID=637853 RepID=A0A183EEU6_9BILA|nr:unnamed protein product [Gongylonema pulchrum]